MRVASIDPTDCKRAFIDTNVLAHIVGGTSTGQRVLEALSTAGLVPVTFIKCVYELYSMIKGTTKGGWNKGNHPLRSMFSSDVTDIAQQLFNSLSNIDSLGNAYYWYNLVEEWQGWDCEETHEKHIEELFTAADMDEAQARLLLQIRFVRWKQSLKDVFHQINAAIKAKGITPYRYDEIYSSDWYKHNGLSIEQSLAKDSLIPNEDFEIVLAALSVGAKVFITEDDKGLIWRGGLSIGLGPSIVFCHPERLQEAIADNFTFRFYRKE